MQNSPHVHQQARDDFNKARSKATINQLLSALTSERQRLLSLEDVKNLLKPHSEIYKGMQTVPINKIVGSEGRYKDFTSAFLPKREFIRGRWESVDRAHISDVILPPIKLYEIGGVYFVRDGNHRVSVARMQGTEMIDAEVIELDTEITITPGMTNEDLKRAVIDYEKHQVFEDTGLKKVIPEGEIIFTEPGRYVELLRHIQGHKYFLNPAKSWYRNLYRPIIRIIREENILVRFPGRTHSDLYMWVIKHWDELKKKYGNDFSLKIAALDFSEKFGKSVMQQVKEFLVSLLKAVLRRNRA
jgi:hypothetical protein